MIPYYPTQFNAFPTQPNAFQTQSNALQTPTIQFAENEQEAKSKYLPPNSSAVFMSSDYKKAFVKFTDANGAVTVESYDCAKAKAEKPVEYVTRAEFDKFKATMKGAKNEQSSNESRKQ